MASTGLRSQQRALEQSDMSDARSDLTDVVHRCITLYSTEEYKPLGVLVLLCLSINLIS